MKIYYDATQLVHWPGSLTGIPRVMHELGIRFETDKEMEVIFVTWEKSQRRYFEIDFQATMRDRGRKIHYKNISGEVTSPKSIDGAKVFRSLAKKSLLKAKKVIPVLAGKVETRVKDVQFSGYKYVSPKHGDIVVITWGEWWDDSFIEYLEQQQKNGLKIAQLIHDLGPLTQPQFSGNSTDSLERYCKRILPISEVIISISKNTERDIRSWTKQENLKVGKIGRFREGDDFSFAKSQEVSDGNFMRSGLKGNDFILTVGTIEAKKNHQLLYYVYKLAASRKIKLPKTVIVGRKGWKTDDMYDIATTDPQTKNNLIFLHNVNDGQLSWLYDNCLFTVFMSFYEGWGMPIAESVSRGVPCICSNTSSMIEIAEGHVSHFNPASTDECLAEMVKLLEPDNLKTARQKARSYKQVTWEMSYKEFKSIIEGLM